jgi:Fe2+ or Zn2+ uptake regulation protein
MRRIKIEKYIVKNRLRVTKEREKLIDIVCDMQVFSMKRTIEIASEQGICHGTVYLFVEMLADAGVLKRQESYSFKK